MRSSAMFQIEKRLKFGLISLLMAVMVLIMAPVGAWAKTANLSVRVGAHDAYDRLVFDWDKMVAYTAKRDGDVLTLTFESGVNGAANLPSVSKIKNINAIKFKSQTDDQTVVEVVLAADAQFKDFRLIRRVIIDAFGGSTAKAPDVPVKVPDVTPPNQDAVKKPPVPEAPPVDLTKPLQSPPEEPAEKVVEIAPKPFDNAGPDVEAVPLEDIQEQDVTTAAEDPEADRILQAIEQATDQATDKAADKTVDPDGVENKTDAKQVEDIRKDIGDNLTDQVLIDSAPKPAADVPDQPTIITVSTIEPTPLAVFTRFDYLWIVVGSKLGTIEPESFGPLSDKLGNPDAYELDDGIAYRFNRPDGAYTQIRKDKLSWQVYLTHVKPSDFASNQPEPEYAEDGITARLVTPLLRPGKIYTLNDPVVGDELVVVPTLSPSQNITKAFVSSDIVVYPSSLGFVAAPRRGDLLFNLGRDEVIVSAPNGLNVSSSEARFAQIDPFADVDNEENNRLFNLFAWRRGGIQDFPSNRLFLLDKISTIQDEDEKTDTIFQLALLYFANGFGDEALGLLEMVEQDDKDLANNLSFLAIRGAAKALAGRYEEAIDDLGTAALQDQPEAELWRGYAAAAHEEWRLAERLFPKDTILLNGYPEKLAIPMTLYMAESALRSGDPARAAKLLEILEGYEDTLPVRHHAARLYLQGEMFRQNNQPEKALEQWNKAILYRDRLYQTKARLAKTLLEWQTDVKTPAEALDTLEHMRFAWRDDALETQILHSIGLLRVINGRYYDGLMQLKDAVRLAEARREDTEPLTKDMLRIFKNLFVDGKVSEIPPLEAVSIFSEFQELMPSGEDGTTAAINFSDSLVDMDLLQRAAQTLEGLLDKNAVEGVEVTRVGARLASIYLLDNRPNDAISILQRSGRSNTPAALEEERQLLRARALSQLDMVDEAVRALDGMNTRNAVRLRADIFWRAGQWENAAATLMRLIPPPTAKALSPEEAGYILNVAVALKLANEKPALEKLRDNYIGLMRETALANSFALVTRSAGRTTLSDRDTMLSIAGEVDIFKGFLDNYRAKEVE